MELSVAINTVMAHKDLSIEQMKSVMTTIMNGQATPAQIGGFLIGLRMKGETVEEIAAAAQVMRNLAARVNIAATPLVDTCGTGGDASGSFNISTASAFVVAAAGAKVAKHGNRSISSKSGSADVLEAAGVKLDVTPQQVADCVDQLGVGFMFAPLHHSAMKHAIGPRKEMGVRTIFNILGPLTNPAGATCQVLGVFDKQWLEPLAEVLGKLGSQHVLVVHSEDGMDEISISAATDIAELKEGRVTTYKVTPEQFGMQLGNLSDIAAGDAQESLATINSVFENKAGSARDIVALNAGAAIYVAGLSESLERGVQQALEVLASGGAKNKLRELIDYTQKL
ncbi:Anthranilate phosphoribosyltransferase [hydrothermal vent metagenome]|uniref:anthranilate phosphoribosyltransferase n=1 Tax=hydrothermal vent metagenome TaxID=652676 RepID=A0A3B0ZED6_9ZZZZ